jgi:hypothetical protein
VYIYFICFSQALHVLQGFHASAESRQLVLALRDYFVERNEHSEAPKGLDGKRPVSMIEDEDEDRDNDPETELSVPLPAEDRWTLDYFQVKRLRYIQRMWSIYTSVSLISKSLIL